jgi:uncharacterized iron-regulated protein
MNKTCCVLAMSVASLGVLTLGGCNTGGSRPAAEADLTAGRGVTLVQRDGRPASWGDVVAAAGRAEVVLIGENHGHPLGLSSAAALWADVLAASPRAVLSMEFFERDEQLVLDDYLAGLIDEATFLRRADRNDENFPPGHRAMVRAAKAAGRPVVAANAPRPYVRLARTDGYDRLAKLTPEQQRTFRAPDALPTGPYRERFDRLMSEMAGHEAKPAQAGGAAPQPNEKAEQARKARLDATFRSQSLWDWTMAQSVASALAVGEGPVVHVVGRFHIDHDGGLPQALRSLRPGVRVVSISFVDQAPPARAASPAKDDLDRADFVAYVGPSTR